MKNLAYLICLAAFSLLSACSPMVTSGGYVNNSPPVYDDQSAYADQSQTEGGQYQSYQTFYDELSPYGTWIDYPDYGYVWSPNVDPNFQPYATDGRWMYSDYGLTWASDYPWGWATFHYGRWFFDDNYGWLWQPGQEWAPAWVTWGEAGDYYGWAPLIPRTDVGGWVPPVNNWIFVPRNEIMQNNVHTYIVDNTRVASRYGRVTPIRNVANVNMTGRPNGRPSIYNRGPQVTDIESATRSRVQPVKIGFANRPGENISNNQINIYRPVIRQNAMARPSAGRVTPYSNTGSGRTNRASSTSQPTGSSPQATPGRVNNNPVDRQRYNPNQRPVDVPQSSGATPATQPGNMPSQPNNSGQGNYPRSRPQLQNNNQYNQPQVQPTNPTPVTRPDNNNGFNRPQPAVNNSNSNTSERANNNPISRRPTPPVMVNPNPQPQQQPSPVISRPQPGAPAPVNTQPVNRAPQPQQGNTGVTPTYRSVPQPNPAQPNNRAQRVSSPAGNSNNSRPANRERRH